MTKKERSAEYLDALKPFIKDLNSLIEKSPDGIIRIEVESLAKVMGMTEKDLKLKPIYLNLKYSLFQEGIFLTTGKTKADKPIFVMRKKMEGDTLKRIDISKFKDIIITGKDDFFEFVSDLPEDLKCSELIEIFSFGKFVEKMYFDSGSCEPNTVDKPELYIKLKQSAKISDVIKIFQKIKPQELDYDESTITIDFWFD